MDRFLKLPPSFFRVLAKTLICTWICHSLPLLSSPSLLPSLPPSPPALPLPPSQVSRSDFTVTVEVLEKPEMFIQAEEGGVRKVPVEEGRQKQAALTEEQAAAIGKLITALEDKLGHPQDFEWAYENSE